MATESTPEAILDHVLKDAVTDGDRRKAVVVALLEGAIRTDVLWGWGPRGYERGGYDEGQARKEAGSSPVSRFLSLRTRRLGKDELAPVDTSDMVSDESRHVLCHLLRQVIQGEDERARTADAIRSVIITTGILWAPIDASPDQGASHDVALRFADGQPIGRTVELRTPRLHEDD